MQRATQWTFGDLTRLQVLEFLNPIPPDMEFLSLQDRVNEMIKIPVVFFLKLTVPVVDKSLPRL